MDLVADMAANSSAGAGRRKCALITGVTGQVNAPETPALLLGSLMGLLTRHCCCSALVHTLEHPTTAHPLAGRLILG